MMKISKKLLSLALAVAMASATIVMPMSAGAADAKNLFERKSINATLNDNKANEGGEEYNVITDNADGSITVTNRDTKRPSSDMMKSCGIGAQGFKKLEINKSYKISIDLKLADSAAVDNAKAYIGITPAGNKSTNKLTIKNGTSKAVALNGNQAVNITHEFSTEENSSADGSVTGVNIRFYVYNDDASSTTPDKLYPDYTLVDYGLYELEGGASAPSVSATEAPKPSTGNTGEVENIILNSSMDKGTSGKAPTGWSSTITESRGAKGSFTWQENGGKDGACALLDIVADGTNANSYGINYDIKALKVESGQKYTLSFDAKVEGVPSFNINNIWLRNYNQNERLTEERTALEIKGSDWKTYTYEMTAAASCEGTKLMLQSGNNGNDGAKVYFDNVKLMAPKGSAGEIKEDAPSTSTPSSTAAPSSSGNKYVPPAITESSFEDCTNHWARPEIEIMQIQGVINGKSTKLFAPEDNITRAEFLALIVRAVGVSTVDYANAYNDVTADKWYAATVQAGKDAGIINPGMTANGFEPEKAITREEMTSMIAAGYKILTGKDADKATIDHFTDKGSISAWASEDVQKAVGLGIIKGITDTTFEPKLNATRAQAAVMIFRLLAYKDKIIKSGFDNDDEGWAITYRTGGVSAGALNGEGKVKWVSDDGDTAKGCMLLDMSFTGKGQVNSEQWVYVAKSSDGSDIIEKDKTYLITFSAKLENAAGFPVNIIKLRDVDNNNDEHSNRVNTIIRGEGWHRYYGIVTSNRNVPVTKLIMQAGGCEQKNVKLYLDDFSMSEIQKYGSLTGLVAPGSESVAAITGSGTYPEGAQSALTAAAKAGTNYLFDKWTDKYGNIVDQSSIYSSQIEGSIIVTANYKPYTITEKNIEGAGKSDLAKVTLSDLTVSGDTASAKGAVSVPEGYKVVDAGILFLDECYAENYNIFTENAQKISVDSLGANGAMSASVSGIGATKDVLAKSYAIIKDTNGDYLVQYSDDKLIQRKSGEIKPYKLINNHEMMHNFTSSGTDPYVKGEADYYIDVYAGTDVEMMTITPSLYRTNTWPSEVDTQWKDFDPNNDGDRVGGGVGAVPVIYDYLKSGGDPFQEMIDVCRRNNFDVFVNQRMNDSHNTGTPTSMTHNRFYRLNPQWHLNPGTSSNPLNYIHPEVREYYFRLVEEQVTKYDLDGLELDFERAPYYFKSEELATGTALMTDFVGRIRAMLDRVGEQKGKYLPLSVRVCKSMNKSNATGLDIEKWDELGYIDMVNITHHYYSTTELDVESYMAVVKNARIMAELNPLTREVGIDGKKMRQFVSPAMLRGVTANFLARGVDGISMFNMNYAGDQQKLCKEAFVGLMDAAALKKAEKQYTIAPGQGIFQARGEKTYELLVPEDPSLFGSSMFRVEMQNDCSSETIEVYINGTKLQETTKEGETELFPRGGDRFNNAYYPSSNLLKYYTVPLSIIKNGVNTFTVKVTSNPNAIIMATDLAFYH